jgi:hypothetical protein
MRIAPQGLRLNEVDPVLPLVGSALSLVELEVQGIVSIPPEMAGVNAP